MYRVDDHMLGVLDAVEGIGQGRYVRSKQDVGPVAVAVGMEQQQQQACWVYHLPVSCFAPIERVLELHDSESMAAYDLVFHRKNYTPPAARDPKRFNQACRVFVADPTGAEQKLVTGKDKEGLTADLGGGRVRRGR